MNTRHELQEAAREANEKGDIQWGNVSRHFQPNDYDRKVALRLVELEGSPAAIVYFSQVCDGLSDYAYWFFLSTCWVKYSGWSDLDLWIHLFGSSRGARNGSIMKPDELAQYKLLPFKFIVYRAHRPDETNWIAYTISQDKAKDFARTRDVGEIKAYFVKKHDVLAYFLRRGEKEIILLDKSRAQYIRSIQVEDKNE
jgi:hypothetical protein